jgi:cytoskeletal protein CcmA (bactofilin family)
MDEISIWHRSFLANEVESLENVSNYSGSKTTLQAYWKMDEGSGTTLDDAHGNNDAILINSPSWQTREGVGSPGVVESETINLSSFANNILVNDALLTLNNCVINGPGVIMTNGNLMISGNSTIGANVTIISGGNVTVSGNVTIGSSIENYSIIYCKNNLSLGNSTTFYGVLIGKGSSSTFNNANIYGASYLESQTVSISNTAFVGSLVSKYSLGIDGSSSITKGHLPDIFGANVGFNPSVLPGSHLEY